MWSPIPFLLLALAHAKNVMDVLKNRATYSQFAEMLENTEGLHKYYLDNYVTVFAPSNSALADYKGMTGKLFILNHIASVHPQAKLQTVSSAISEEQLEERLTSLLHGHPPLWIRRVAGELFVNQAKVSLVLPVTTTEGKKQFLYLLDSVLEPLVPKEDAISDYVDVKAGNVVNNTDKYNLGEYSVKRFADQIIRLGSERFPEFSSYGKFTFFLPVDSAFQDMDKGLIDEEVVRSHIVPGKLLFTRPTGSLGTENGLTPTVQFKPSSMEVKVVVSIYEGSDGKVKAQSQTMTGNRNHKRGKVIANIIKGNIPVQNGIIHLIDKPLVILTSSLWDSLDPANQANKRFQRFAELVADNPELKERIMNAQSDDDDDSKNGATLLVPTNAAFDVLPRGDLDERFTTSTDLLGFHFIDHIIESTDIRIRHPQSSWGMFGTAVGYPAGTTNRVWFWNNTDTVFVDGGGVEAEVVEGDIRATNGIIHVIDKVLGVPMGSVLDKLKTDPMITKTYQLGHQDHFNRKFGDREVNYTYLVPSNQAWDLVQTKFSTAYKVLFMGEFFYQANHILERHLKVGEKLNLAALLERGSLGTLRGPALQVYKDTLDGEEVVMVSYEDLSARVVRGNLECANGYIHIIDDVIMKRRDVTLSGSWSLLPSCLVVIPTFLLSFLLH